MSRVRHATQIGTEQKYRGNGVVQIADMGGFTPSGIALIHHPDTRPISSDTRAISKTPVDA
ncbi:hypothetical protein [Vibrio penaeicida]|uniref:hypothetical protein n=1 Tax=Vibrio penaeicida TaxID=104609 RepID=UPI001CC60D0C|nr:hypothetical protein [Vibrio penaeicida]